MHAKTQKSDLMAITGSARHARHPVPTEAMPSHHLKEMAFKDTASAAVSLMGFAKEGEYTSLV